MIELLTSSPELLVALLGIATSTGLTIRALPAILDRVAKARETAAQAELIDAESHANALRAQTARALAAEKRATDAENRERKLADELRELRASLGTYRGPHSPHAPDPLPPPKKRTP